MVCRVKKALAFWMIILKVTVGFTVKSFNDLPRKIMFKKSQHLKATRLLSIAFLERKGVNQATLLGGEEY